MRRPLIVDAFPFHDELDILECRLVELYDTVDWFVLVEADVTHQDRPKGSYYLDYRERFEPWADKVVQVWATGLPTMADDPDPWARELAQREWISEGLARLDLADDTVVMQSDVDEIPRPLAVRNLRPGRGFVGLEQRGHFWAVDWLYPHPWNGTVAGTVESIAALPLKDAPFGSMRNLRNNDGIVHLPEAGWHLSWLGGPRRAVDKVNSFCHPEVEAEIRGSIANDNYYWREGVHVDKERMLPVDVDESWPRWIVEGNAPKSWYRPR